MNSAPAIDLIIVGQGLAGSAVAMRALERHLQIRVYDQPSENRSSRIAAGMFNPITGKNMVKSWLADEIFPSLFQYYREIEQLTNRKFFYSKPMYRPFQNIEEQNEWMGKSADPLYQPYISHLSAVPRYPGEVKDPLGGITLRQAGYLDTGSYIEAVRGILNAHGSFVEAMFDSGKLEIGDDWVRYGNHTARKIVFCQGVQNALNPWFNHIPVKSLKGEFLTVQSDWKKDVILNRGVYMVPGMREGEWRVGSTYDWSDHSPEITDRARDEITHKLEQLICLPYRITGQEWGVRPTTADRKPILGGHPKYNSLIIFNGFGTKGVSLGTLFFRSINPLDGE